MRALPLLVMLLSCRAAVDPLSVDRQRLAVLAQSAPSTNWVPEAVLVVHESAFEDVLGNGLEQLHLATVSAPLIAPLGVEATFTPRFPVPPSVSLGASQHCEHCVAARIDWSGVVDIGLVGQTLSVRWTAHIDATVDVAVQTTDEGRALFLRRLSDPPTTVDLDLESLPEPWNYLASSAIETRVITPALEGLLVEPMPLLQLTDQVRDVRVRGDRGLVVEMLFNVLESGQAVEPRIDEGWAVSVPARTLLGLARASALEEQGDYLLDPTSVQLFADRFAVTLRLWKVGRRYTWRDYRLQGELALADDEVRFVADEVVETEASGWGMNPLGPIVRTLALGALEDGVRTGLPARMSAEYGARTLSVVLTEVDAERDVLEARGELEVQKQEPPGF